MMVRQGNGDFWEDVPFRYTNMQVARDGRMGDRLMTSDKNNFAPRLGIAWSPTSKWAIRGGAGMFYSQEIGNPNFDMTRTLAGRSRKDFEPLNPSSPLTMANFLGSSGGSVTQVTQPYTWAAQYDLAQYVRGQLHPQRPAATQRIYRAGAGIHRLDQPPPAGPVRRQCAAVYI